MLTLAIVLVVAALIITILSMIGKAPLAVAVLLLCVLEFIRVLPVH